MGSTDERDSDLGGKGQSEGQGRKDSGETLAEVLVFPGVGRVDELVPMDTPPREVAPAVAVPAPGASAITADAFWGEDSPALHQPIAAPSGGAGQPVSAVVAARPRGRRRLLIGVGALTAVAVVGVGILGLSGVPQHALRHAPRAATVLASILTDGPEHNAIPLGEFIEPAPPVPRAQPVRVPRSRSVPRPRPAPRRYSAPVESAGSTAPVAAEPSTPAPAASEPVAPVEDSTPPAESASQAESSAPPVESSPSSESSPPPSSSAGSSRSAGSGSAGSSSSGSSGSSAAQGGGSSGAQPAGPAGLGDQVGANCAPKCQ